MKSIIPDQPQNMVAPGRYVATMEGTGAFSLSCMLLDEKTLSVDRAIVNVD
jgi:hypothetical protein